MGSEGCLKPGCRKIDQDPSGVWALWMAAILERTELRIQLTRKFDGILDNRILYAATLYQHPVTRNETCTGVAEGRVFSAGMLRGQVWDWLLVNTTIPRYPFLLGM